MCDEHVPDCVGMNKLHTERPLADQEKRKYAEIKENDDI